jgi:hypothetical protein
MPRAGVNLTSPRLFAGCGGGRGRPAGRRRSCAVDARACAALYAVSYRRDRCRTCSAAIGSSPSAMRRSGELHAASAAARSSSQQLAVMVKTPHIAVAKAAWDLAVRLARGDREHDDLFQSNRTPQPIGGCLWLATEFAARIIGAIGMRPQHWRFCDSRVKAAVREPAGTAASTCSIQPLAQLALRPHGGTLPGHDAPHELRAAASEGRRGLAGGPGALARGV